MKRTALFAFVLAALALPLWSADEKPPRPNILYILADDLGWEDVSFHNGQIKTPNLDKLAASGARLEAFYVQPVCSPTRAALMTGRYPMRHGLQVGVVRPHAQYGLPLEERTLPQALKEAGYETAICGKWHLGHFEAAYLPTHRGFDHQYGHYNGALDYFTHIRDGGLDWHRDDKVLREEGYTTHLVAKECVRLINEHDKSKPLFLYVPFNAVHAPHQVPEKYTEPYPDLKGERHTYAGMVAAMDEAVGTIIEALEAKGLRKDTLIIFSSDNGGPAPGRVTSNGPLRAGKATLYEGGVRVCAFATWEDHIPAGSVVNEPIHMVDWFPTLLRLAGGEPSSRLPLDGRDIMPTIAMGAPSPHSQILLNITPYNGAIRVGDWKLVLNGNRSDEGEGEAPAAKAKKQESTREKVELFNLAEDLGEKTNLAELHPEKVRELRAKLESYEKQAVPPKSKPAPPDFKVPKVWGEFDK